MCLGVSEFSPFSPSNQPICRKLLKRSRIRIQRRGRWRRRSSSSAASRVGGTEMELKNMRLYLENKLIKEENEKLRKRAAFLHQENQVLMMQFQKK